MGQGYFLICEKCKYQRELMLGSGMMWGNLENIISFMDKNSSAEASKIIQEYPNTPYSSDGNCVYQCRQCFSIQEKIHLLIYDKNQKIIYRTQSNCSKCKVKRKRVQEKNIL